MKPFEALVNVKHFKYQNIATIGRQYIPKDFVVVGIVECLQPDHGGWKLIDSHGAGTAVFPFTTGKGVGTETCGMDNVFPPDDL